MERDTRLHRANNNEEFVGTERRREAREDRREREEGIFRSLNAFSLALCALNDEEETLYVSRWEKKEEKKKRKGKKYEVERERSGDGRRCCWWWWRCVVDGERNELQDGIAVGSSDEKPSKAKSEGGGEDCRETGKNERHGGEFGRKVKESNLCEIIRCLVGIVSLKSVTIGILDIIMEFDAIFSFFPFYTAKFVRNRKFI